MLEQEIELQQDVVESSQETFLQANLLRIDELKKRIKEYRRHAKDVPAGPLLRAALGPSFIEKTALKIEKDIHNVITNLHIPNQIPLERYCQTYQVGIVRRHVFGVVIIQEEGEYKLQGISDINGRERFTGSSAEEILTLHFIPRK